MVALHQRVITDLLQIYYSLNSQTIQSFLGVSLVSFEVDSWSKVNRLIDRIFHWRSDIGDLHTLFASGFSII